MNDFDDKKEFDFNKFIGGAKKDDSDDDDDEFEDLDNKSDKSESDDDADIDLDDGELDDDDISEDNEKKILDKVVEPQKNKFNDFISDDEDDDDEEDENYLQKFNENIKKQILTDYHPELQAFNYEEVDALTRVVRDENGIIVDPLHRTLPFLTKYEKARILGERAKQIECGAMPFVKLDEKIIDSYAIACKELEAKKIPFIIKRPLPNGGCEFWKLADLEFL